MQSTINATQALEMLSTMPTLEEMDQEGKELDRAIAELQAAQHARQFGNSLLYSVLAMGHGAMQGKVAIDHTVSRRSGEHMFWTVKTDGATEIAYSKLKLYDILAAHGANLFTPCVALVPSSEGAMAHLDTDDLKEVLDIDPDKDLDQLDELETAD